MAFPTPEFGLLNQPFILLADQLPLILPNGFERQAQTDRQQGPTKIEGTTGCGNQEFRQETDKHDIDGADNSDTCQHIVYVFGGTLTRTNARNKAGMLLELVSGVLGIEHNGRIEEAEECHQCSIEQHVERL